MFLLRGSMSEGASKGFRQFEFAASSARFSGADAEHNIDFGADGGECLVIHTARHADIRGSRFICAETAAQHISALTRHLDRALDAPILALEARRALTELSGHSPIPDWLSEARRLLLSSETRSVSATSRIVGVSREHLSRRFLCTYGANPQETLRLARAARAAAQLARGESSAGVAGEAGYADQSHLIREVRAFWGLTPRQLAGLKEAHHTDPIQKR